MAYETGALSLLRSKSLPAAVKEEIANLIISGQLAAGQKLTEFELAERLGVSRGPIREALLGLEEAGLIRMEKNRGVFVREISPDEANELYEVRAGLEGFAGRLLAPRVTPAQIATLRGMVTDMAESIERTGIDAYFPQNLRFHEIIVEFTGNAKLLMLYRRLINEMYLIRRHELLISGMRISVAEHSGIVDALESRSGEDAARVMEQHVLGGRDRLIKILQAEAAAAKA
jgi:phosphonate utilization transcriptional regulator